MLRLLCFALPLLYWPEFVEVSNTPRWIALSLFIPLFFLRADFKWTTAHSFGTAWLALAGLSLLWTPSLLDGILIWWHFILLGLVFCVGSSLDERQIKSCVLWFAAGMVLNGFLAVAQFQGFEGIKQTVIPAGTFANKNFLAEAALVAFVGCLVLRRWILAGFLLPALILPFSKGVLVALGVILIFWIWQRSRLGAGLIAVCLVAGVSFYLISPDAGRGSLSDRLAFYPNTVAMVLDKPWGQGIGAYWSVYPLYHDAFVETTDDGYRFDSRPRTAHNDLLTLTSETGILGFLLLSGFVIVTLWRSKNELQYVVLAFLAQGVFNFPLYLPTAAFLAALCAGYISCHRSKFCRL